MPTLLERALIATRASRRIELKERFDFDHQTARDVAALANSGGGAIVFGAPAYRVVDYDKTHPYRQKELLAAFRARSPEHPINQFDFLAVRTVHDTDERPEFTHKPMFGSRQYSESFLEWLVAQARRDPAFFDQARRRYRSGMLSP